MWKSFIEHRRFVLFRTHWQFCGLQWIGTCIIGLSGTLLLTNHLTTSKWILTWPQFTIIGKTGLSSYLRWYEKGGHCWLHPSVGSNGWVRLTKMKLQNNDDVRTIYSCYWGKFYSSHDIRRNRSIHDWAQWKKNVFLQLCC
jgi:hypothetical protein